MLGFLNRTLFPDQRVSLIAADERMKPEMRRKLEEKGLKVLNVPASDTLQASVSGHPDMQMVHVCENIVICQPHLPETFTERLREFGFDIRLGSTELKPAYPFDVAYNVAIIGKTAFHNTKYTDGAVLKVLEKCSIHMVHVKQGYTKCSVLPVTPESLITADKSIADAAKQRGFDVLYLPPQTNIRLPGMNYGFIGGTAGFIDKNVLAFTGAAEALNSAEAIGLFLKKHGIDRLNLGKGEVYDYGGLIPLCE